MEITKIDSIRIGVRDLDYSIEHAREATART
jgi:hypothetical protein